MGRQLSTGSQEGERPNGRPGTDPGLLEWYAGEMGKSDVEVMCGLYGLLRHASAQAFLAKIKAPVLGLYPTGGPITSREQEEQLAAGAKELPWKRLGRPDEIGKGVVYVLSDDADYMTGSTLSIEGGVGLPWWSNRSDGQM